MPKTINRASKGKPEGPYESGDQPYAHGNSNHTLADFLEFFEQFESETEASLKLKKGYSESRMQISLLKSHLSGKLTTTTSLIDHSGLSYGTAIRGIESMRERGLIVRRPRTASGKSYSLHPSPALIEQWQELYRRSISLMNASFGLHARAQSGPQNDYFFGASYADKDTIPPPAIFDTKLALPNELKTLVHADPTFMAMHALKKQVESIFGVGIRSRALSIDRLREEIIKNGARRVSSYDIVACDLPWFGEMADNGVFMPLDDLMRDHHFDSHDFHPVALASARYSGQQYGVPVQTTPELLCCRSDLLQACGLEPPRTIEQTLSAARAMHQPHRGHAGIAWNAARGTPLGHAFLFVMGAFGQPALNLRPTEHGFDCENINGDEYRPQFNTPAARDAAEYLQELLSVSPRGILTMSWYERAKCYAEGGAAMAYNATLLAPLFESDSHSAAYGRTTYVPHPHGPAGKPIAPLGGYALAIPANIAKERIEPVWQALQTLTSAASIKLYIENGSLVSPRFSVCRDPQVRSTSPLISIVDDMARSDIIQHWPRPPVPPITEIIDIVGHQMHDMLIGQLSASDALQRCQASCEQLMRKQGYY